MAGSLGLKFTSPHILSTLVEMVQTNPTLGRKMSHVIPPDQTP
jgi:hypothetical protein